MGVKIDIPLRDYLTILIVIFIKRNPDSKKIINFATSNGGNISKIGYTMQRKLHCC